MSFTKEFPFKYYLVGGQVRDQLLGLPSQDCDYVVLETSADELKKLGFRSVGKHFPVFLHPTTNDEYALARTEKKIGHGHQAFEFNFSPVVTLKEDLYRRDFTVNAMCMDHLGNIIDFYNGQNDLKNKVLRHISEHFSEDPLRILRGAKFCARLGFTIAPETIDLMKNMVARKELEQLSIERVREEFSDALLSGNFGDFVKVLTEIGAWKTYERFWVKHKGDFEYLNKVEDLDLKWALGGFYGIVADRRGIIDYAKIKEPVGCWQQEWRLSKKISSICEDLLFFHSWATFDVKSHDYLHHTAKLLTHLQDGKNKERFECLEFFYKKIGTEWQWEKPWKNLSSLCENFQSQTWTANGNARDLLKQREQFLNSLLFSSAK